MFSRTILTDYRIRSLKVLRGAVIAYGLIHLAILVGELLFDLKSTALVLLVPSGLVGIVVIFFAYRNPDSYLMRVLLILLMSFIVESHFLYNPRIFHIIGYWFPFIPITALILMGMRAAQFTFLAVLLTHFFNAFYLRYTVGDAYAVQIESVPFLVSSVIFTISILSASFLLYALLGEAYSTTNRENVELVALKKTVEEKRNLLERYLQEVIVFSRQEANFNQGRLHLLQSICRTVAANLAISRVSVWLIEPDNETMVRKFLYEQGKETAEPAVLGRAQYPGYFQALESKPFIVATHARSHPDTREFAGTYLESLDILSMLDCPVIFDNKPVGVICCEHQHHIRNWNAEDTLFVQSMSDFIALSFKNERITNLLFELRKKNFELVEKNNEIETMNEELNSLNEELTTVNEKLEETVKHRTRELETQNTQLTEYAFINSHLLRAPLTRILGLSQLISSELDSATDAELINALIKSTNELDLIVRRISEILYDGNNFTRDDIKEIIDRNLNQKSH